jgi:hypothetical protein
MTHYGYDDASADMGEERTPNPQECCPAARHSRSRDRSASIRS